MKKIISILLCLAMMISTLTIVSAEEIKNLATGLTVSIRGYNGETEVGTKNTTALTDGSTDTYDSVSGAWHTDAIVDLGTQKKISGVQLYRKLWDSSLNVGGTVNIAVEVSTDGTEYTRLGLMSIEVLSTATGESNRTRYQKLTLNCANQNVRYIKLVDTDVHNGVLNSLGEIIVVPGYENIVEGKSVSVTRYSYDGNNQKVVDKTFDSMEYTDGDTADYLGNGSFHGDMMVDLGKITYVNGFTIYRKMTWLSGNAVNDAMVRVSVSTNGDEWTTVGTMNKTGENASSANTVTNQILTLNCASIEARYVKLAEIQNHNGIVASPSEIIITEGRHNVAIGGKVTFYSTSNVATDNTDTANVVDGDYSTRASGKGQWAYHTVLELKEKTYTDAVQVTFGNDAADNLTLMVFVSADGKTYVPAGTLRKIANRVYETTFEPQVVKNVKIFDFLGDAVNRIENQYSVAEIEVYEADTDYAVAYTIDGANATTLQNGTIRSELISSKLLGGVIVNALYNQDGQLLLCKAADIANGESYIDMPIDVAFGKIAPKVNIAAGKTAYLRNVSNTADQKPNGGRLNRYPSYLTDGDAITYAQGSGSFDGMMKVDLGAEYDLEEIEIDFMRASDKYEICISTDDETYTTIYSGTEVYPGVKSYMVNGQKARYIGVFNKTQQNIQHRIAEIRAYEPVAEKYKLATFVWNSFDSADGLVPLGDVSTLNN